MSRKPHGPLVLALRMLEAIKAKRMTREELAIQFSVHQSTVWMALRPMVEIGLVLEEKLCHGHDDSRWRWHYSVSPEWFKKQ